MTAEESFDFTCNICGADNVARYAERHREGLPCGNCNSCARFRGIVKAVQTYVLQAGRGTPLASQAPMPLLRGIGMSDSDTYAAELARICDYSNTYYHTEPFLDITDERSSANYEGLDFVISSDVLEHVSAPVSNALSNIYSMLKNGGHFILSVPYLEGYETIEHFPHLAEYSIVKSGSDFILINYRADNLTEFHRNLTFHGGPGSVLEMRIFGEGDLVSMLRHVGFEEIRFLEPNDYAIGYSWDAHVESALARGRLNKSYILVCTRPLAQ
jgi:SAM-dependent methyltransferase